MSSQQSTGQIRPDGSSNPFPHPLDPLSVIESDSVRDTILRTRGQDSAIHFRSIFLEEPLKKELSQFLDLEAAGKITSQSPRPARIAKVQYDVIRSTKYHEYMESWIDVKLDTEVRHRLIDNMHQAALTT
jgi:primary-amine oxidase